MQSGEIYRKTNTIFRENGYIVKVFNLKDMTHSDRWNPLRGKRRRNRYSNKFKCNNNGNTKEKRKR